VLEYLDGRTDERDRFGTVYTCGYFAVGDVRWRVAVGECGPGNHGVQQIATFAISHFQPRVIMFVGVAGSLKADVELGDVVASTKIYNVHSGKAKKNFLPRPLVENTSYPLEQLARAVARADNWLNRIRRRHPERPSNPSVHVGPIAAGEQVDADARSQTHKIITQHYGDALAVEMEGYGTLVAARIPKIDAIVIRAISDKVVNKAECDGKGWQPIAAHYASAFAFELLANYRVGQRSYTERPPPERQDPPEPGRKSDTSGRQDLPADSASSPQSIDEYVIRAGFASVSAALLAWPADLGQGEWIFRPELRLISDKIAQGAHSTTLLLGVPGSGKSALLARLGGELEKQGIVVLAIKADTLREEVKDAATLASSLQLPAAVGDCVRKVAASSRVTVLVDQLDALAALVDLRTGRLNVLLNLIRELDEVPNVHVVCSCREFEHHHDARLTAIEADAVQLSLPTWEQVAEILKERGVAVDGWPASFQELLRPPQRLKVFLQRLTEPSEPQVFASYQLMLDNLWGKVITNADGPPGRSELVMDIATAMANREGLWVPAALFEERAHLVEHLVGVGILTRAPSGAGIGFSHQTLFEHAWARAFAREKCSLANYALERQHGLFIRSTVWAGLNYLRGADPANYRREFARLWDRPDLRRHLRHLLVDFLGTVENPDNQEQAWLFGVLSEPALTRKALLAVHGNAGWFSLLAETHLPRLMRGGDPYTGLVAGVLIAAWPFAKETCLGLTRQVWLPDKGNDALAWHVLSHLAEWDEKSVEAACDICARSPVNRMAVMHLATQVAESAAPLAPRVVAAALEREIGEMERQPDPEPEPLPDGAPETERIVQEITFRPKDRFRQLLEDSNGWFGLEALAEKAPGEFLSLLWPLFLRLLRHLLFVPPPTRARFLQDYCLGLEFSDDENRGYALPQAIDLAIRTLAKDSQEAFLSFLSTERGHDSETVQRLLARGLTEVAPSNPALALQFLMEDERRFELGPHTDRHQDSLRLIEALVPHLSPGQVTGVEAAILEWSRIQPDKALHDARHRFEAERYNREHRLRLLSAIPRELLSAPTRALVRQEAEVFPRHKEAGVSRVQGGWIGSPMSSEQMLRAKTDDIIRLFRELTDATESHHPKDWLRGGSVQASREFEVFATKAPDRACAILAHFQPGQQERPAGAAVVGLGKASIPDAELFRIVGELDARGFRSESFRVDAATAFDARLKEKVGLPDSVCRLLERWLAEPWQVSEGAPRVEGEKDQDRPASILWRPGGMVALPYGTYHLLHALTYGYLMRSPPATERWLSALEAHCERPESVATWQVLCHDLRYLTLCDHERATRLLRRLFERFPGVLESEFGAGLLTHAWSFAPEDVVWGWLARLRSGKWTKGPQVYGEIVALRSFLFPEDGRANQEISLLVEPGPSDQDDISAVRTGVSFACANMWDQPAVRHAATDRLIGLLPQADDAVARAIMQVFLAANQLPPDEETHRLLQALVEYPGPIAVGEEGWFLERLEGLLPNEAELVFKLSREVVRRRSQELGSIQTGWALHAASLTTIAITLQRLEEPFREMGLELFEGLLDIHLPDAEATLREIDQRPPGAIRTRAPRARRKGRK
jgi:nucleoside phosphorylase